MTFDDALAVQDWYWWFYFFSCRCS